MTLPEEDRKRIEAEAEKRVPPLLGNSRHTIGPIHVNDLEICIRDVAVNNQIEAATAERIRALEEINALKEEVERLRAVIEGQRKAYDELVDHLDFDGKISLDLYNRITDLLNPETK